jgi:hypothetical protein
MKTTIKEQARFDARLPKEQKQFFERLHIWVGLEI